MKLHDAAVCAAFIIALSLPGAVFRITHRPRDREADLRAVMSRMTIEEKVGQLLMVGLPGSWVVPAIDGGAEAGDPTVEMNAETADLLARVRPGGVILFRYNVESLDQLLRLTDALQASAPDLSAGGRVPLFISADQEGGRVTRLCFSPQMPGNMALGATRDPWLAYRAARASGRDLRAAGLNWNFAPVMDVNVDQDNPVIGVRSYGGRPGLVARMGVAAIRGAGDAGIISSAKHFPGHGDTWVDSHLALPLVTHDRPRLERVEFPPFRAAIAEGVESVMTAHIIFPALDDERRDGAVGPCLPATLSRRALSDLLKGELGFHGLVITDAMEMKAVADNFGAGEAAVRAVRAGADMLICTGTTVDVFSALVAASRRDPGMLARVDDAVFTILSLKERRGVFCLSGGVPAPCPWSAAPLEKKMANAKRICRGGASARVEREAARRAVTLVSNSGAVPLRTKKGARIAVFAPGDALVALAERYASSAAARSGARGARVNAADLEETDIASIRNMVAAADCAIVVTHSRLPEDRDPRRPGPRAARAAVEAARSAGKPVIAIAHGLPADLAYMRDASACIAVYSGKIYYGCAGDEPSDENLRAGMDTAFGLNDPRGRLPVDVSAPGGGIVFGYGTGLGYGRGR